MILSKTISFILLFSINSYFEESRPELLIRKMEPGVRLRIEIKSIFVLNSVIDGRRIHEVASLGNLDTALYQDKNKGTSVEIGLRMYCIHFVEFSSSNLWVNWERSPN